MKKVSDFLARMDRLPILLFVLLSIFIIPLSGMAQERTITGSVGDEEGNPLSSVSIILKGSRRERPLPATENFQ